MTEKEKIKVLLKKFYEEYNPISSQIESFNKFCDEDIKEIVREIGEIRPLITPPGVSEVVIKFRDIWVSKPEVTEADGTRRIIYPIEARLRNLTYSGSVYLEYSVFYDDSLKEQGSVEIGKLPIMVKSKYCNLYGLSEEEQIKIGEDPYDFGGYFIINGTERVIVLTEELLTNKLYVDKGEGVAKWVGRIFSESGLLNVPHKIELLKDGIFYISFGRFKRTPVFLLIKALGLETDKEIYEAIGENFDEVFINLYEFSDITNKKQAALKLANLWKISGEEEIKLQRVYELIDRYLLPHLGRDPGSRIIKAWNLCKYIKKILYVHYGKLDIDDKDHYMNKQIRMAGNLIAEMFRYVFKAQINDMLYQYQRMVKRGKVPTFKSVVRSRFFTERFETAMGTGTWTRKRVGVSQMLERMNKLAVLSHLTRVRSPIEAEGEVYEIRMLHGTHWGRLCPIETPESKNVGLRKNLSLFARISQKIDEKQVIEKLKSLGLKTYYG